MFSRFSAAPAPCLHCNHEEYRTLHDEVEGSGEKFWVYQVEAQCSCSRCAKEKPATTNNALGVGLLMLALSALLFQLGFYRAMVVCWIGFFFHIQRTPDVDPPVQIPIPSKVVGQVERALHCASITTNGSNFRAHGSFISLLSTMDCEEEYKQALCCWAPLAMKAFNDGQRGASRKMRRGRLFVVPDRPASSVDTPRPASPSESINTDALQAMCLPPANPGTENGMAGTQLPPDAYGSEERVFGNDVMPGEPKPLAYQIGPDLIPTEVMSNSVGNLKAGMAKRNQPLPFKADKAMVRKIEKTVNSLLKTVFTPAKIKQWRFDNPVVEEFCSSKWSPERFRNAFDEAISESRLRIEQTFQIKTNEALPAKGKAPRPIIQCGDRAQVMMALPVKCFEDLLFDYFESASIKHVPKYEAMQRVSYHLKQRGAHLIEGDGSAWDACCNSRIRNMTENRIMRHIIQVLGGDPEVPDQWMDSVLTDMEKAKLKGKAKVDDFCISPIRVCIESIRQSGHRGTSCFNYLINLIGWLCVLCQKPEQMISKLHDGTLRSKYISAFDGREYSLKYSFEGDDSALSTTEDVSKHTQDIEKLWTSLGFRMKLVFVDEKLTFTGFDFLCDENGPTGVFVPEVARNIASSSWTTSMLVKQFPHKASEVGAAAMMARAINFKDCGPLSAYFAALGLAHVKLAGDRGINSAEAKSLAVHVSPSIRDELKELHDHAGVMTPGVEKLLKLTGVTLSAEQQAALLRANFGGDPLDLNYARRLIPFSIWDPAKFSTPRR